MQIITIILLLHKQKILSNLNPTNCLTIKKTAYDYFKVMVEYSQTVVLSIGGG